jgi:hypothetical protein
MRLRAMPRVGLYGVVLTALLAVSGCSWLPWSKSAEKAPEAAPANGCPTAVVVRPLANTVLFGMSPLRGPDNVAFYGILSEASAKCENSGDAVRVKLEVIIAAERGPVASGNDVELKYFAAVVGPDQGILARPTFDVHITIPEGHKRAGVSDTYQLTIPLGGRAAGDLTIDFGFLLSPEVVEFYKHYRGR